MGAVVRARRHARLAPTPGQGVPHSLHFWITSRLRWPRATMSWRANMRARCVSSRQRAHRGCPQVLQKYVVSESWGPRAGSDRPLLGLEF